MSLHRLAITCGDAAGIGPEIVLRFLNGPRPERPRAVVYGNGPLLRRVARAAGLSFPIGLATVKPGEPWPEEGPVLVDFPFPEAEALAPARVQACCGRMAYTWIEAAVRDILAGRAQALVTAPINKAAMHAAGYDFPGHTELLGRLTHSEHPDMIFHSDRLTVGLVTIHEALRRVPSLLTVEGILRVTRRTRDLCGLRGIAKPRIEILALNPHAGEGGIFGDEEARIIAPAVAAARAEGIEASGPLVPDTALAWLGTDAPAPFDAAIAMYHDQGLIPFKMVAFESGVNVTAGLPFIRTSPDHGTAYDKAWKGTARPDSLYAAIGLAARA